MSLARIVRAGVGRRRVQSTVIALVAAAAVTASVLAAGLLQASSAPFDHAFAAQHGAHLTVEVAPGKATAAQLTATGAVAGVSAVAGPYPTVSADFTVGGMGPGGEGRLRLPLAVVGRPGPGGGIDELELSQGKWPATASEIVVGGGHIRFPLGTVLSPENLPGAPDLTVVGIARSVSATANAWVLPAAIPALTRAGATAGQQMLYRLDQAGTAAEVDAGRAAITAALPSGAVAAARSWRDVRREAVETSALFVPFLVAFAVLALAMSVLIVGNVIAGVVGAGLRRIGILKALGLTPAQVVRIYLGQALLPAGVGAAAGVVAGNLIAIPVLADTEEVYGSANLTIAWWVDGLVVAAILGLVAVTAWAAALRAGRLRTVDALAVGRVAGAVRGRWASRIAGRLPLPRPLGLGLARPFARPLRSMATLMAVLLGTAAVTFAIGLAATLVRVQAATEQNGGDVQIAQPEYGQAPDEPGGRAGADPAAVLAAIHAVPGVSGAYGETERQASAAGVADPVSVRAFAGDASWNGFAMIAGRWFTAPGEAVVGPVMLKLTGTRIGDTITLIDDGVPVRVTVVGEVFDNDATVFTDLATLTGVPALAGRPDLRPGRYEVGLTGGTDPDAYVKAFNAQAGTLGVSAARFQAETDSLLLVLDSLTATLALLLVAVAALGVLNMVVLDLRDRVHDLGVHKALGMTPRQTIAMVLASVSGIGLLGGLLGVPAGIALQRQVVPAMGRSAGVTVPHVLLDVYGPWLLVALTLGGLVIAAVGALGPAGWAARTRTATALRTE